MADEDKWLSIPFESLKILQKIEYHRTHPCSDAPVAYGKGRRLRRPVQYDPVPGKSGPPLTVIPSNSSQRPIAVAAGPAKHGRPREMRL
jgi:hypothetical protein